MESSSKLLLDLTVSTRTQCANLREQVQQGALCSRIISSSTIFGQLMGTFTLYLSVSGVLTGSADRAAAAAGQAVQARFAAQLRSGIAEEDRATFERVLAQLGKNAEAMRRDD